MNINNTKGISAKEIQQYMMNESLGKEKEVQGDKTAAIPQEKVDISDKAREIQQTTTAMNEVPDVREEKVQALKSQIDNGTYKVSSEELAKNLLENHYWIFRLIPAASTGTADLVVTGNLFNNKYAFIFP